MVQPYNGILLSNTKEQNTDTYSNIDEPWRLNIVWFNLYEIPKKENL